MKHARWLALATVGLTSFIALIGAGSASATVLCKTTADPCGVSWIYPNGTVIDASAETSITFKTGGGTTITTCTTSTLKLVSSAEGSSTTTVSGTVSSLTMANCSTTVDVIANGTLEVHKIAGTSNGTITSTGLTVTENFLGVSCSFKTNATDIGTLTEGASATLDISGTLPEETGNFGCPSSAVWSGNYKVTEPSATLSVSNS